HLELAGFEVVKAEDGAKALERIRTESFDLVLSDIRMPGLGGVELFQQVKALRPGLPVVLMTAFALEDQIEEALSEGAFAVLSKPFDTEHVVRTLVRAVRRPVILVVGSHDEAELTANGLAAIGLKARAAQDLDGSVAAIAEGEIDICVADI